MMPFNSNAGGKRLVFMGTPEFAAVILRELCNEGYEIGYVVTKLDSQRDRGKKVQASEVKLTAIELGIPVLQPGKLIEDEAFYEKLKAYKPDLIVVAAYGKILPKKILELPRLGCVNVHASLLPRFRGAAPIQRAILKGDEETGVTLMQMAEGLDTGDMLATASTRIEKKNTDELFCELANLGAKLLVEKLPELFEGNLKKTAQDESKATYADTIEKSEGKLDFDKSPEELERQIRAIPSFAYYKGELLKVWKAEVVSVPENPGENFTKAKPGDFVEITKKKLLVKCGDGVLSLKELQLPGKKRLNITQFLNGNILDLQDALE